MGQFSLKYEKLPRIINIIYTLKTVESTRLPNGRSHPRTSQGVSRGYLVSR
jgi:hypothetical protein